MNDLPAMAEWRAARDPLFPHFSFVPLWRSFVAKLLFFGGSNPERRMNAY
jgi:hypothetical protein